MGFSSRNKLITSLSMNYLIPNTNKKAFYIKKTRSIQETINILTKTL